LGGSPEKPFDTASAGDLFLFYTERTMEFPSQYKIHEIRTLSDLYYDSWLDLYQSSFALKEQMKISELNELLRNIESGVPERSTFIIALDDADHCVGIALFERPAGHAAVPLWYLATAPDLRSKGIGTWLYKAILNEIRRDDDVKAMIIEVETPKGEDVHSDAVRRINFYTRNGVQMLSGISYIQSVGWQPPLPMSVMIHPVQPVTPLDAFDLAKEVLGDTLTAIGVLSLG
jgi:GNAT superfamily N-acetyltransferase